MYVLLVITWLGLPLAPLNPVAQDTINAMNLHVTAGVTSPNGVVSAGPEVSTKFEYRPFHPFIVRAETDFRAGSLGTRIYPESPSGPAMYLTGNYQSMTVGMDMLYYRGTDHLTAYLGLGMVYGFHNFDPSAKSQTILRNTFGIDDADMQQKLGYRLTFGLRFSQLYSFEVGITEIKPNFLFRRQITDQIFSTQTEQTRFSSFRFTLGYIFPLREW